MVWVILSRRTKKLTPCDDPRVGSVIDAVVRQLHAEGTIPAGHNVYFTDESGNKALVEVKPDADGELHWVDEEATDQ